MIKSITSYFGFGYGFGIIIIITKKNLNCRGFHFSAYWINSMKLEIIIVIMGLRINYCFDFTFFWFKILIF